MHDWTRVKAGTYHNFHLRWVAAIMDRLNAGLLPAGYFAMAEQMIGQPEADVVTLQRADQSKSDNSSRGTAVAPKSRKTRYVMPLPRDEERYARRANRIAVHHELGEVVAVIELVSPGKKDRKRSFQDFINKAIDLLQQKVNLLLIDPFPPGPHDPNGIHAAICQEMADQPFELPPDKPLTLVAYQVDPIETAYVEPIAVADRLPDMPLFLQGDNGIDVPLEETYQTTWNVLPREIRQLLDAPAQP
jgi:hypothetical protein